ncbi:E3 ubiquitin-protein ligase UPL5 [Raphanus sativus]|nr:E3 ubiquitin-protein ligase UPL5 [Raphanus sativus]
MMSGGKTIVIHADRNDTVEHLHHRIQLKTHIPVAEQRVIYKGKQLQFEHTLNHYSIEQDSSLHLVGRMQSTEHPVACQTVDEIMSTVSRMHRGENLYVGRTNINDKLVKFFARIPAESNRSAAKYLKIFSNSSVPAALVMLFLSPLDINRACGKSSIKLFLNSCVSLPMHQQNSCLPVVLEFCRLLRGACPTDNKLYVSCRNTLGSMLDLVCKSDEFQFRLFTIGEEIYPCVTELADVIGKELVENTGPSSSDVHKFSSFWQPLKVAITAQLPCLFPLAMPPLRNTVMEVEIGKVYQIFRRLLTVMDTCMSKIESFLGGRGVVNTEAAMSASWSQYLAILKIMDSMCELYLGAKEQLATLLNTRKVSFSALVLKFAKREDDHQWIFDYKEATTFESRRHLAMLLFPDVKEDYDEMHEMLIDRSNLFAESFEYISGATPGSLHSGLFMEFKNEEATGPGVLREWFYLVCQEIFNPRNALFLRSADDFRRFSPNPASKVDPLHLSYFEFTGRVIALALMHKVQVGVLFDRVFFTQLANPEISLEDIKDTDRVMYNSCKQILEMDPAFFDSNAGLGLTFELETEELGKRETVELLPGGKSIAVNSQNREQYVKLLIKQRFAASISQHVERFSKGFYDILSDSVPAFFKRIYLEDFDGMLRGGESPISIDDWKAHTEYNGFKETDRQIDWFWKIMKKMTEEERRSVLFFWTSTKFIPVEGFRGLSSKLYIYRLHEANDRLPTSHTCFYRLCLPKYPTSALMEQRLRFIAQDHVSSSFGKW